jgi:hypothetical protein
VPPNDPASPLETGSRRLGIFVPDNLVETGMQAFAEVGWQLKDAFVGHKDDDIARGIKNGGADFAMLKVAFHFFAYLRVKGVVNVFGDAVPDVAAT